MTQPQNQIATMVHAIRRCWSRRELGWFALVGLAALALWLLAMIVADNVFMLAGNELIAGWLLLGAAVVAWTLTASYRLTLGRPRAARLALMYEARLAGQRNRLVNAVDFLTSGQAQNDPMALAAVAENAAALDPATASSAIDRRPLRRAGTALGICLAAALLYGLARPALVQNALQRLLNPAHPRLHLLATDIQVSPGAAELIEGQALPIQAQLAHHIPSEAFVEYRVAGQGWNRAAMTPAAAPAANFTFDQFKTIWQPLDYRVAAGRSTSPIYHVAVESRPRVVGLQATTTLPAYVGGQSDQLKPNVGDIAALAGSKVHLAITASVALRSGQLTLSNGSTVPLKVVAPVGESTPATTTIAEFTLTTSGSYSIGLTDLAGRSNVTPPHYSLTALDDQPPMAIVTEPGRDLILPADATIDLALAAQDDYGLANVALQVRPPHGDWKDAKRWDIAPLQVRNRSFAARLTLPDYKLKVGEVLLYRVTAADHRQPQPNVFTGRNWSITAAAAAGDNPLLAAQNKQLLEALSALLALQKQNRQDLEMDRAIDPVRGRQKQILDGTLALILQQRQSVRPPQNIIDELVALSSDPMPKASALLSRYEGNYQKRLALKPPILAVMDEIIARLEALVGKVNRSVQLAEQGKQALEKLSPAEREQALKQIKDTLEKLRQFIPEQAKTIADTEELVRKANNFNKADLDKLDKLKGTEDQWADTFAGSTKDIAKLTEQTLADQTVANDYKEMVEAIEDAAKDLNPKLVTMAVSREQAGREMAKALAQEMEMWLPSTPDNIKWVMEEPLDKPEIPMVPLPDNLSDLVGDLIAEENKLTQEADDVTSAWADSISAAGWGVSDGPISNFSAVGKTGNTLPNNQELSGRSGDGRGGKSQGSMVGDTAKGLDGRKTPTRVTNDDYEKGVVKELQQTATGGATGGGKTRGSGQEGLQGQNPPPLMDKMDYMRDWQQRIRQKAEQAAGQLRSVRIPELDRSITLMKQAEQAGKDGRYADMFKAQQMVLQQLRMAGDLAVRETALRVDQANTLPAGERRQILDAMDEPVPQEYRDAVRRYFEKLSEEK